MTERTLRRAIVAASSLALVASACFGGGGNNAGASASSLADRSGNDVGPPGQLSADRTALPGLFLATNSSSWQEIVGSAEQRGALILFVEPHGPSDRKAIARGDLLVRVDDTDVFNAEHAKAVIQGAPEQERELHLVQRDGEERSVTIELRDPGQFGLRSYLDPMIEANPGDPVLRYMRAATGGASTGSRIADADRAIELEPTFVEAIALRASLLWTSRGEVEGAEQQEARVTEALGGWQNALDLDPDNIEVLADHAPVIAAFGNADAGRAEAEEAIEIDPTFPRGYSALGQIEIALDRPEDALGPLAAAVELNPFNAGYWRALATVFNDLDRPEDCTATVDGLAGYLDGIGLSAEVESIRETCG